MLKQLAGRSLVYFLGTIVNRCLTLLLLPVYTRYLRPEDYGVFSVCNSIALIVGLVATLSLESSIGVFYYKLGAEDFRRLLATVWLFLLVAPLGLIAIGMLLGGWLGPRALPTIAWFPYIQMTLWIAYLNAIPSVALMLLQARQRAVFFVLLSSVNCLLTVSGVVLFVVVRGEGVKGGLEGQLASGVVMTALASGVLLQYCRPWASAGLAWPELARALRFSLPYLPYGLFMWLLNVSDRWILARHVLLSEVGLYSLAYSLGMLMLTLGSSMSMAFGPVYYQRAGDPVFQRELPRLAILYALVPTWAALGLSLLAPEFFRIAAGPAYCEAARLVPFIALAYWLHIAVYQLQILVIEYHKRTRLILWLTGPAAVLNIVLNIAFVPRFGSLAAALTTVLGFAYTSITARWFATRLGPIPYPWRAILKNAAVAIAAYSLGSTYLTRPGLVESILAKGVVMMVAGTLMLHVCGFSLSSAWGVLKKLRSIAWC